MCGITGIITIRENISTLPLVEDMTRSLAHRGPDGESCWQSLSKKATLGHRRLSIIDLSPAGSQPMHYFNRYTIVHNGEIYNYIELRIQLEKQGYVFQSASDTEVILAAYDFWKEKCLTQFDGMFSFALWDEQEQVLFAARDRFGEKPFFYHFNGGTFFFASEMKALWKAGIDRKINNSLFYCFLSLGYVDNPEDGSETFFETISKLPAANYLIYDTRANCIDIINYWDIDLTATDKNISQSHAIETFTHLFNESVQLRLRSDVLIGTSLSGGLDSTSVLGNITTNKSLPYLPKAITATFPGHTRDEWEFASMAANFFGVPHFPVTATAQDFVESWEQLCYHQEEPFGSASIFAQYIVYQKAREMGVPVMLDGQGADETLAGYHKFYKWYWQELFLKRQLLKSGEVKKAHALGITEQFTAQNMMAALFPELASVFLEQRYIARSMKEGLNKEFVKEYAKENYYSTPPIKTLNGALYFDTCMHGLEELLRYADRNSMAHGVEVRLPFLSHKLVEFLYTLPAHFKINDGWSKWLLRQSQQKLIPQSIAWRKDKIAFEPPQQSWMHSSIMKDRIATARNFLVKEKILIATSPAFNENDALTWRQLQAAHFLMK